MHTLTTASFVAIEIAWLVCAFSSASADDAAQSRAGLMLNEDNSHFFSSRQPEQMTLEGLNAFVDQYAGTTVTELFLSPNAMRASFRSSTRDAIWDEGTQTLPTRDQPGGLWPHNARLLYDRGLDPYAVWIARCREKGIVSWLSMRMNDLHEVTDPKNFMHSTFWVQHPEFRRVPDTKTGSWTDRALDYGHPEVRDHAMAFVRELLERYDPDGLELDWMRFGYHFAPGKEAEGAELLTAFMREVRSLAQISAAKRGHPIRIAARVPTHPDAARGLGMDGVLWAKEGLVDVLVPSPFWTTSDFDIPMELWREQMGDAAKHVVLAAGLEFNVRGNPSGGPQPNDLESVRGFAAASLHRGADRIYLFNFMDSETIPVSTADYRVLIEKGMSMDVATSLPRRHIVSYRDTVPAGFSNGAQLPLETRPGGNVRIYIGPAPDKGTTVLMVGLVARDGLDAVKLEATANGHPCGVTEDATDPARYPGVKRGLRFVCPNAALKPGYNEFALKQTDDGPSQQIVWAELRVDPNTPALEGKP